VGQGRVLGGSPGQVRITGFPGYIDLGGPGASLIASFHVAPALAGEPAIKPSLGGSTSGEPALEGSEDASPSLNGDTIVSPEE
jgi:hypothetical protein